MATELLNPLGNQKVAYQTLITGGGGSKTLFFPIDPRFETDIQVKKNSEDATISITTQTRETTTVAATVDNGGAGSVPIVDLELAQKGDIKAVKRFRRWYFSKQSVLEFIKSRVSYNRE